MECLGYGGGGGGTNGGGRMDSLSGCFPAAAAIWQQGARSRRPVVSAVNNGNSNRSSANLFGCAGGISDIRDILASSRNAAVGAGGNSKFYVRRLENHREEEDEKFLEEITSLSKRQTVLFQRSCEQLKDLYNTSSSGGISRGVIIKIGTLSAAAAGRSKARPPVAGSQQQAASTLTTMPSPSPFGEVDSSDVEELYVDTLYCLMNQIGCDADRDGTYRIVEHLRKAFRFDSRQHLALVERASARPAPEVRLEVAVASARNLVVKDGGGDPFCTVGLRTRSTSTSLPRCIHTTTTCSGSSSGGPGGKKSGKEARWDESFSVPLPQGREEECVVQVDAWSLSSDENLRKRLRRVQEVKDPKGLKQFLVSTVTGNSKKSGHKLIGTVEVPVRFIPSSGFNKWWALEKRSEKNPAGGGSSGNLVGTAGVNGSRLSVASNASSSGGLLSSLVSNASNSSSPPSTKGELHLTLHLSTSDRPKQEVLRQHRRLLRALLAHELLRRNSPPFSWRDDFSEETMQIMAQHAVQGRLSREDTALSRWVVYCEVHRILPLDHRVFTPILEKLRRRVTPEDSDFHERADGFATDCVAFVRRHRHYMTSDDLKYHVQLEHILKCLHILHCLNWRTKKDVVIRVEDAVVKSVQEWYDFVVKNVAKEANNDPKGSSADDDVDAKMAHLIKTINLLSADLASSAEQLGVVFSETLNVDYARLAHRAYERRLRQQAGVEELIGRVCDLLRPVSFVCDGEDGGGCHHPDATTDFEYDIALGRRLFELYLALQKFYALKPGGDGEEETDRRWNASDGNNTWGSSDSGNESNAGSEASSSQNTAVQRSGLSRHHRWFIRAVAKWLDISLYKAMRRIQRAVDLDDLSTVDELVKYTTSAVDIRTVLSQIKTFWRELEWPDPETSYVFISRILDDACRAAVFYAERMRDRVERMQEERDEETLGRAEEKEEEEVIHFGRGHCLAVNNIGFVLKILHPFALDLGVSSVLVRLEEQNGGLVADACKKTVRTLVRNAAENVEHQILKILGQLGQRMSPTISRLLSESLLPAVPLRSHQRPSYHRLLHFLDVNLIFLRDAMDEDNFERALSVVWAASANCLSDLVQKSIKSRRPASHFAHLYGAFRVLLNFFFGNKLPTECEGAEDQGDLARIARILRLYSCDAGALLAHYYGARHRQQCSLAPGVFPFGSVTARVLLQGSHLRVEVLNARHLKPVDVLARPPDSSSGSDLPSHVHHVPNSHLGSGGGSAVSDSMTTCSSSSAYSSAPSGFSTVSSAATNSTFPRRQPRLNKQHRTKQQVSSQGNSATLQQTSGGAEGQIARILMKDQMSQLVPLPSPRTTLLRDVSESLSGRSPSSGGVGGLNFLRLKLDDVRLSVQEAHLAVHRNLKPNGHCNPYVTVRLVPPPAASRTLEQGVMEVRKAKTRTQKRTLFPLFDETFDLLLPREVDPLSTYVHFTVKDRGVMGEGIFLGEAYLPLSEVDHSADLDVRLKDLPQTQLPLTRPSGPALEELLFAIQTRASSTSSSSPTSASAESESGGKSANVAGESASQACRDFLRKERRKMLF